MKDSGISFEKVLDRVSELDPAHNPAFSSLDDIASGQLFAHVFKDVARFNTTSNTWMSYNGQIWQKDEGSVQAESRAKDLARAVYLYGADQSREFQKYAYKLQSRNGRNIMLRDAIDSFPVSSKSFDQDLDLFNIQNGIYNLHTGELMKHDAGMLLSKIANASYMPEARSELFERFISEIFEDDQDRIRYVQKLFGYAMTGDNCEEQAYLFYGPKTRNGKSTLLETVAHMLGDYALNMSPDTLAQKPRDSRSPSGDIARLDGCRFLHASEPPKRMLFDVALLKTLLGRDKITARHLHEREFEFVPRFVLFINTNYLPLVNDDTLFSSGRIKVVTFDRHFSEAEQDRSLKRRLKTKDNLSGIFNWCLEGLRLYREEGLEPPPAVVRATADYREQSDKIGLFVAEELERDEDSTISGGFLYRRYSDWCEANGYGTESKRNFFAELKNKGLLSDTGTIGGQTVHNVVRGWAVNRDQ